jgi:hypothetical protein
LSCRSSRSWAKATGIAETASIAVSAAIIIMRLKKDLPPISGAQQSTANHKT